ncbi:MAG TPA: phytoene/squalene synthase family protein [Hyphomicrobiales bacterium]|nr:phytoene/squalene synthase family protein [Rhodobiaceae bacterium]HXK53256.1 phytoene/squalene synthase family protein [Hyphomicrobiales bacterium]
MNSAFDHCATTLRLRDPERYLATRLAPQEARAHLTALYALDCELSAVRERITEPLTGEIRLQWWRDAIAGLYSGASGGHPVLELLGGAIAAGKLPQSAFEDLIDARIFDLYDDPMASLGELEAYLGASEGALIQLSCLVLAQGGDPASGEAAGHAGMARGIARLMSQMARHCARGQCYVPGEILARHGVAAQSLLAGNMPDGLGAVLAELAGLAQDHFARAGAVLAGLAPALYPAFAPCGAVPARLRAVLRNADPLHTISDISPLRRHWAVSRAGRVGL